MRPRADPTNDADWPTLTAGRTCGMALLALLFGLVAIVLFLIDAVRTKSLTTLGLAFFVAMFLAEWPIRTSPADLVRFH